MAAKKDSKKNYLDEAIATSKQVFRYVLLFSMAMNLLMLATPIYSLQVLDRVVSSRSMETLVMLTIVVVGLYVVLGIFTMLRSMALIRLGEWFDHKVSSQLLANSITIAAIAPGSGGSQNLRDLATLKSFLTGPALSALFDAPWALIYIAVLYAIHPLPGLITLLGGLILLVAAIFNERAVKTALGEANEENVKSMSRVDSSARNAEVIEAMGMMDAIVQDWQRQNAIVLKAQSLASNRSAVITSVVKSIRLLLQTLIIGFGAYLVTHNELTTGAIIACSIIGGKALAPFEQAIGAWSAITSTRKAYARLSQKINAAPSRQDSIDLPAPEGRISVEKLVYAAPNTQSPIIKGISFQLNVGESLGIIGPSAAGKSTLAKLMTGVYRPNSGNVRLDGADVYSWNRRQFGKFIGYLPQDVELFDGSVKDNIARLQKDAPDENIVGAAQVAGAHDMILRLANGYETQIGAGGSNLSSGQRQRIGLARAFFGNPCLLILDEPNSNLDEVGEMALVAALKNAKALKTTSVIVTHRPNILNFVDKILVMKEGTVADFGPAQEIMAKYMRGSAAPQKTAAQLRQQGDAA